MRCVKFRSKPENLNCCHLYSLTSPHLRLAHLTDNASLLLLPFPLFYWTDVSLLYLGKNYSVRHITCKFMTGIKWTMLRIIYSMRAFFFLSDTPCNQLNNHSRKLVVLPLYGDTRLSILKLGSAAQLWSERLQKIFGLNLPFPEWNFKL